MALYKFQKVQSMNGRYRHLPKELWRNDFPIVLVHGFAGSAPDQTHLMGNYFLYALQASVQPYSDVYVAVVSPFGGFHDRACELYQQLIGINAIKKSAGISVNDNGTNLVRAVYGHRHYCEEHKQQKFYKPRLLRKIAGNQFIAYPDGVPGGWSSQRKIHFIGHSMGAQTVRYLQTLMSFDYFAQNKIYDQRGGHHKFEQYPSLPTFDYTMHLSYEQQKKIVDRSDWFASLTSLNGAMNGGAGTLAFTPDPETRRFEFQLTKHKGKPSWVTKYKQRLVQICNILDNFNSNNLTSHKIQENIKKKIQLNYKGKKETILQLGMQNNYYLQTGYSETWGLSRNKGESLVKFIRRVWNDPIVRNSNCFGLRELTPTVTQDMNSSIKTFDSTYYFSMSTGERKRCKEKQREILNEPRKYCASAVGFDLDVSENIKNRNSSKRLRRRQESITMFEQLSMNMKVGLNIIDVIVKLHTDNMHHENFNIPRLSNLKNKAMNNLMSFDFAMRDWLDDTDFMLPRLSAEFPRTSAGYVNKKQDQKKPWGDISEPVYMDPFNDENLMRLYDNYQPGIWYYTGYPLTDHHEFCGIPNVWRHFQTLFGLEYRPGFYINIYNRIRNLDFTESSAIKEIKKQKQWNPISPNSSFIGSEMLETVKENRSSDFSFTDYLEQEIENQTCNIKSFQLNIDDENTPFKTLKLKTPSITDLSKMNFESFKAETHLGEFWKWESNEEKEVAVENIKQTD